MFLWLKRLWSNRKTKTIRKACPNMGCRKWASDENERQAALTQNPILESLTCENCKEKNSVASWRTAGQRKTADILMGILVNENRQ
jgi:hypothetical protein